MHWIKYFCIRISYTCNMFALYIIQKCMKIGWFHQSYFTSTLKILLTEIESFIYLGFEKLILSIILMDNMYLQLMFLVELYLYLYECQSNHSVISTYAFPNTQKYKSSMVYQILINWILHFLSCKVGLMPNDIELGKVFSLY